MREHVAKSWDHLQELLFAGSWNTEIERHRSPFVFRGLSSSAFDLRTSLMRLGGDYSGLEKHLLRNFRKYGHDRFQADESIWHWLTMAQHHGLPTRLLDWTYSPFVSMHFATADIRYSGEDGVIWKVNYHQAYQQLPRDFQQCLDKEGGNVLTVEMLDSLVSDLSALEDISDKPFFVFFEPPSIDARIVNQHGLFSMNSKSSITIDTLLGVVAYEKIVIPSRIKWEIRDKLDQANITERVLFPGLEGLSEWLKRHYSPRS